LLKLEKQKRSFQNHEFSDENIGDLEIKNLSFKYNENYVLKNVNMLFASG